MRWIVPSALRRLLLLATVCVALVPTQAAAQPAEGDVVVLVNETFDNPNAGELTERDGEDDRATYERGEYVLEGIGRAFTGQTGFWLYDVVADGTIAVDVRLRGAVEDRYVFVGCRDDGEDERGYVLTLDLAEGAVDISAVDAEGYEPLTDFLYRAAILTGNRTNRIELHCFGSTITGRVNGVEAATVTDERFQQGSFSAGVGVYGGNTGPVEGVFDNLLVTMAAPADPSSRREAKELDQFREEAQAHPSLFGPSKGEVRWDEEGFISERYAGVAIRDFYATATFVNPYDVDEQRWSVGIASRNTGSDEQLRIFVRSTGRWYFSDGRTWPSASGPVPTFNTAAGSANTIDVAVVEETGYLAVNGEFLATFDASTRMTRGDVWIGASFFWGDNLRGDRTAFHDFEVWGLGEDAAPAEPDATPATGDDADQPRGPAPAPPTTQEPNVTCDDFLTQDGAQYALDITRDDTVAGALDPDGDGIACAELPSRKESGNGNLDSGEELQGISLH